MRRKALTVVALCALTFTATTSYAQAPAVKPPPAPAQTLAVKPPPAANPAAVKPPPTPAQTPAVKPPPTPAQTPAVKPPQTLCTLPCNLHAQHVMVPSTVQAPAADPYGFVNWLNVTRASYGLPAVGYDPNLTNWANVNNGHQNSRGMGHYVMGPARRQNSAMGNYGSIGGMWMASPAHRAALLDPTIRFVGIAGMGAFWTFNAY